MGKLNLENAASAGAVFDFFEEISEIPRGSGNTKKIADYLENFAQKNSLWYKRDALDNVVIKKGATAGKEASPTVILQGHTDIVADKIKTSTRDMVNEGLELYLDGDFIRARETTLGADDGIAVAYMLALLASRDIPHPAIEAVFTSDEEIGLIGATGLDTSVLDGKIMINVDSDEEGVFTAGCAGGVRVDFKFSNFERTLGKKLYKLSVSGLFGGHSGVEIHKNRLNAIKALAKTLDEFSDVELSEIYGGSADNAIPRDAYAVFCTSLSHDALKELASKLESELQAREGNARVVLENAGEGAAFSEKDSRRVLALIEKIPYGVIAMEAHVEGAVESSMNLGVINTCDDGISLTASIRSSKRAKKHSLMDEVRTLGEDFGASVSYRGEYPEWEYKENSVLRELMCKLYREKYGKDACVIVIHAGLECGIFSDKIEGLDCISIGPDEFDIHTPEERVSVSSAVRVWEFIKDVLKNI